jgi:GNAT superfamily N-acetyltransferase/acyl carrier protein
MAARSQWRSDPDDALLDEVALIVRRATGIGSARVLPIDDPLGTLGLDSLSLVNAVAAVEGAFERELPDELWEDRRGISIASLAAAVALSGVEPVARPLALVRPPEPGAVEQPGVSRFERLFHRLEQRGVAGRTAAHALHGAVIGAHWTHSQSRCLVLERELTGQLPAISLPSGVTIAPYDGASDVPLAGIWTATQAHRRRAHLRRRMQSGIVCLAAWEHQRIVAFDLIGPTGAEDVATRPGTCFGLDLYERRSSRGRGIGLGLLAASLRHARDLGFSRQATIVLERNRPMIAAATQMLGFTVTGHAARAGRLGRVTWTWRMHGSTCSGPKLFIEK